MVDPTLPGAEPAAAATAPVLGRRLRAGRLRTRWPSLAGLGFAGLLAADLGSGLDLAPVLAAATTVYLGAAALGRSSAAWPMFGLTVVVLTLARVVGVDRAASATLLGVGVVVAAVAVLRGRRIADRRRQLLAFAGFGLLALVALALAPVLGSLLVAAGLLAHAGWDLVHHRANGIVSRSLAEFCGVLDTTLAVVIVVLVLRGA